MVASSFNDGKTTYLTTVAHQAPARLIPLCSSSVAARGAAIAYLGNYGGGMLAGDILKYNVHVQPHARLAILTQGSNRIYKQQSKSLLESRSSQICQLSLTAQVDQNALLVMAPDPVTPFENSALQQRQKVLLHHTSSLCFIDWFSSGRFANGERWQQHHMETSTQIFISDKTMIDKEGIDCQPQLMDSILLGTQQNLGMDWGDWQCNSYATIYLYGSKIELVQQRCHQLHKFITSNSTKVRDAESPIGAVKEIQRHEFAKLRESLSENRVLMSVSKVDTPPFSSENKPIYVVRLAAMSNEDVYRILRFCLEPLGSTLQSNDLENYLNHESFGFEFYKDRIRAVKSAPVSFMICPQRTPLSDDPSLLRPAQPANSCDLSLRSTQQHSQRNPIPWTMLLLADSSFPTGSFAHSSGLEAAAQLGLLQSKQNVQEFVEATVQSFLQLSGPIVQQVHDLTSNTMNGTDSSDYVRQVDELNERFRLAIVSNGPAYLASVDQGKNFLRVAVQWALDEEQERIQQDYMDAGKIPHSKQHRLFYLNALNHHFLHEEVHLAVIFGALTALLGISKDEAGALLGYCVARDTVSAAVRLNLIGPLSSVAVLANAQNVAVQQGWQKSRMDKYLVLASCAPVLDAVHPCHNILALRLFRS